MHFDEFVKVSPTNSVQDSLTIQGISILDFLLEMSQARGTNRMNNEMTYMRSFPLKGKWWSLMIKY